MTKSKQQDCTSSLMYLASEFTPGIAASRRQFSDANPFIFFPTDAEETDMEEASVDHFTVKSGGQSLIARRPHSQRLPPLMISGQERGTRRRGGERGRWGEVVVEEGKELFSDFMYHQAQRENPEAAERLRILSPATHKDAKLVKIGRELRHIAQSLANSPQRQTVRHRASQINPKISCGGFKSLLTGLFAKGGITREGIVVLFFFCSDVALRTLKDRGMEVFHKFVRWSLSFISESVCAWVLSHGGWGKVMSRGLSTLSKSLALAGVILVGFGVVKYVTRS